jgi:type II secretory pathway pseudopilin PulG
MNTRKGQVWIETVLYTLIGLALIAIVLAYAAPKISESKDKILIEQSIGAMQALNDKIEGIISSSPGSKEHITFTLKKGEFGISSLNHTIAMTLNDLNYLYSEDSIELRMGNVLINSTKGPKTSTTKLTLRFDTNITYNGIVRDATFPASATPYKFSIEKVLDSGGIRINLDEVNS